MKGLIHIYCGEGKGKTTASIGLAIRATGSGKKVVFAQFLKGSDTSELNSFAFLSNITVMRNSIDYGFYNKMTEQDKEEITKLHNDTLNKALNLVEVGECDLLILDEITPAYNLGLVDKKIVEELISNKKEELELVFTGRNPEKHWIEAADYVTEMKKIKHPYEQNIAARKGIEY